MADSTTSADERRKAKERAIDAAVYAKLTCPGCGKPLVVVTGKKFDSWTCPTFGCSRMLGHGQVTEWIVGIVASEGLGGTITIEAEKALKRYLKRLKS